MRTLHHCGVLRADVLIQGSLVQVLRQEISQSDVVRVSENSERAQHGVEILFEDPQGGLGLIIPVNISEVQSSCARRISTNFFGTGKGLVVVIVT